MIFFFCRTMILEVFAPLFSWKQPEKMKNVT